MKRVAIDSGSDITREQLSVPDPTGDIRHFRGLFLWRLLDTELAGRYEFLNPEGHEITDAECEALGSLTLSTLTRHQRYFERIEGKQSVHATTITPRNYGVLLAQALLEAADTKKGEEFGRSGLNIPYILRDRKPEVYQGLEVIGRGWAAEAWGPDFAGEIGFENTLAVSALGILYDKAAISE